jgi:hypothetical protein
MRAWQAQDETHEGFLADVARARARADRALREAETEGARAEALGRQVRCALLSASVVSQESPVCSASAAYAHAGAAPPSCAVAPKRMSGARYTAPATWIGLLWCLAVAWRSGSRTRPVYQAQPVRGGLASQAAIPRQRA